MHLVSDSSVPAHVRNDSHILAAVGIDWNYESWARENWNSYIRAHGLYNGKKIDDAVFDTYVRDTIAPIPVSVLWDKNVYDGSNPQVTWTTNPAISEYGLSEFTNANYFSEYTIFTDYSNPKKENTNAQLTEQYAKDGTLDKVWYIQGYKSDHLAALSYFWESGASGRWYYHLDQNVYQDYATELIPRAVGYSAALLDYFFRGDIRLEFQPGSSPGYAIVNNSKEDMNGRFEVYYDNAQDERIRLLSRPAAVSAEKNFRVDLPIAADAKEPGKYILVFIGKMGNEEGAVAGYVTGRVLQISPPSEHVYSQIDPKTDQAFTKIGLKIKNTSSEVMPNGSLQAIVRYKKPGQSVYSYAISAPEADQQLVPSVSTELSFNFDSSPIPLDATNVYLYVVYTGAIGTEKNAVAVGERDISEPTPVDLFNNMDRVCMKNKDLAGNGLWYTAGSADAIDLVDTNKNRIANEWDVYTHNATDVYIRFSEEKEPLRASPAEYNFKVAKIDAGTSVRALYILSEYKFNYSFYYSWKTVEGSNDPWYHVDTTHSYIGTALINQTETTSDKAECGSRSSCTSTSTPYYYPYRGTTMWWGAGFIFTNRPYPDSATCLN
ncbi:MAG: hypothetical protein M0024_11920 [Nitrospiraceae bacterium]|nr:hypothetical protein [Nitrospiraceae bacterium]